MIRVFLTFV